MSSSSEGRTIVLIEEFSDSPYGRYPKHGDYNGECFREKYLKPALDEHDKVIIQLDGTYGLLPSFLEEAFGGLVRLGYFTKDSLEEKLILDTKSDFIKKRIFKYISDARFGDDARLVKEMDKRYRG